ncbi:MAG: N-6 DNA methylase [Bacteroidia bacterium]|nr:N-6 DNA methylase [Bacteroidia bacterium]
MDLFVSAEINKPKKHIYKQNLSPINNLKVIFREIRDYFAGNVTGITRDEKIAQNIMRLLFCKIYDEKYTENEQLVNFANRPNENIQEFQKRIFILFENVKNQYSDIFESEEELEIQASDLSFIVSKMEEHSILNADRDIIADAFEELIGTSFRGGEGQFFTPRNIVQMMIDVLQPTSGERIIDPACGSGGFIAHILQHLIKNKASNYYISGIDKDLFLSKLAKIYLTILGESEYHIFCENSLEVTALWKPETQHHIQLGTFDLILANPPFGAKIPVIGENLLKQYELGYFWQESTIQNGTDQNNSKYLITKDLRDKQPPQILFVERIIQLLKTGGRAGIVLPEGIFGNPSDRYVWEYVKKYCSILGIVSLSQETFQPSTHTKTSVVFLEKKPNNRSQVFMAIAKNIGHDKNGKPTFKFNKDGSYIFDKQGNKILDDETPEIAQNFTKFLNGTLEESVLGFAVSTAETENHIYIPETYKPEVKQTLLQIKKSGLYDLTRVGDLAEKGVLQIKRGNEIGSKYYGTGDIPFVRTTDIVNWEIKANPIKSVAEEIYWQYKEQQDVRENDILFVNDGTFLIGRSAILTENDKKCIIQSHLRKIRVLQTDGLYPFYLFYLLNSNIVREQVEMLTFVQATLSTLGNRIMDLQLPIHKDKNEVEIIGKEVRAIVILKKQLKERTNKLTDDSL